MSLFRAPTSKDLARRPWVKTQGVMGGWSLQGIFEFGWFGYFWGSFLGDLRCIYVYIYISCFWKNS